MQTEIGQVVFVCYQTDKQTGNTLVVDIADSTSEVIYFLKQSREDFISRSVKPFVVWSLGSSMSREVPENILRELKEIIEEV